MCRVLLFGCCLALGSIALAGAAENNPDAPDTKVVKGMSVLGNNEAPMALFIVPWKSSELGGGASVNRTLQERDEPVDRDVFLRELEFYRLSVGNSTVKNVQK